MPSSSWNLKEQDHISSAVSKTILFHGSSTTLIISMMYTIMVHNRNPVAPVTIYTISHCNSPNICQTTKLSQHPPENGATKALWFLKPVCTTTKLNVSFCIEQHWHSWMQGRKGENNVMFALCSDLLHPKHLLCTHK
jgi:hypothetical protein